MLAKSLPKNALYACIPRDFLKERLRIINYKKGGFPP
jgi:hypothetical protein